MRLGAQSSGEGKGPELVSRTFGQNQGAERFAGVRRTHQKRWSGLADSEPDVT